MYSCQDPEPNEEKVPSPPKQTACAEEEDMQVEEAPPPPPSFAPKNFTFQAPLGLSSFKFEPLTPRSADAFLTPRSVFVPLVVHIADKCFTVFTFHFMFFSPTLNLPPVPPFTLDPPAEPSKPSPPRPAPAASAPSPCSPLESKHDVPYFRYRLLLVDSSNTLYILRVFFHLWTI